MKKTVYICDHCKAEFDSMAGYSDIELNNFNFVKEIDLCPECYQELCDIIRKFIHEDIVY